MKILISLLFLLSLSACTNTSSNSNCTEHDSTDTVQQVNENEDSVTISEEDLVIKDVLIGYSIVGKTIRLGNSITLDYDNSVVSGDTLVLVTDEKNILPMIDFHDIYKAKTEKQIRNIMGDGYKVLKTVKDDDMVNNVDGNYEIPYLFFISRQDSLQYMINFPYDNLKTPYTYQFCEAIFYKNSKNPIAKTIFNAISKWHIMDFVKRYPRYKHVWLIPTCQNDDFTEWSLFIWFDDTGIYRVLISICACDELIYNEKMSSYMYGLEK